MERSPLPDQRSDVLDEGADPPEIDLRHIDLLLDIADVTIATALVGRRPVLPALDVLPQELRVPAGVFVTLTVAGELAGCIGTITGVEPLGHAVARLALSAAFADPRLPALERADYPHLTIELSLLAPPAPIGATSRTELRELVRPGLDGVVVVAGSRQALFLPGVWSQLPDPDDFLDHLWLKAGLTPGSWPASTRVFRFRARSHERRAGTSNRHHAA